MALPDQFFYKCGYDSRATTATELAKVESGVIACLEHLAGGLLANETGY